MFINKNILNKIKKGIVLVTSATIFTSMTACSNTESQKKQNDIIPSSTTDINTLLTYKENEYITKEEYDYYTNLEYYNGKSEDEIAIMFSENRDIDTLKYILFIAPLSKEKVDERKYDNIGIARNFCRDLISEEFHDSIIKSLEKADSNNWRSVDISERIYNNSTILYDNMKNYIEAWNNNDADKLIKSGIIIKRALLEVQPYDFFAEKIESQYHGEDYLIYLGNHSKDSKIKLSDYSYIKQYYDYVDRDDYESIESEFPGSSLLYVSFRFYIENYFDFITEEYELEFDHLNIYAVETTKKNNEKTLTKN